jgi:tetratricopeptide (TPR) repeat protein
VRSLVALFGTRFVQGNVEQSYEVAERALALAGTDTELAAQAHFAFAGSVLSLGQPANAASHFDLAMELSHTNISLLVGTRLDVHSQGWSAHAHWLLGDEEEATARARDALDRARAADHPYSIAVALAYAGITAQLCGDPSDLEAAVSELDALCQRYEFAYYGEWALILEGWNVGGKAAVTQVREGISRLRSLGSLARMPYWLYLLSSTLEGVGRREEAAAVLDGAIVDAEQRHERWWLPEVLRRRAAFGEGPAADALLRRASAMAGEQGSQAIESRCLADLAARQRSSPLEGADP